MVAYDFQARFADLVARGEKRQTIRAVGKRRHAAPGEPIQLYTGMRTRGCRKLITPDPVCIDRCGIRISASKGVLVWRGRDWRPLENHDRFAWADGFSSWPEMLRWFQAAHDYGEFNGWLIKWAAPEAAA